MFLLSFVLEDWAIHELVPLQRRRRVAVVLVASSYVTWTYQTHTFSNSIETIIVLWSLVLIKRITEKKVSRGRYPWLVTRVLTGTSPGPEPFSLRCPRYVDDSWCLQSHYVPGVSDSSSLTNDTLSASEVTAQFDLRSTAC